MKLDAFSEAREADWDALEKLLRRARGRAERLGVEGALELGALYRATAADLAQVRTHHPDDPLAERLESLVRSGRAAVYDLRVRRGSARAFFARDYWRLVLARPGLLAVAVAALVVPTLAGALWAISDPGAAVGLLPVQFRSAGDPHLHRIAAGAATQATFAGSIFTNNIQVTFFAFAGGLLFGAGTLYVLAYNGILLGTLAGLTIQAGAFGVFVRYVVPHGMLELSCITVSGLAGLWLGMALIDPGTAPRGEALRRAARPAVGLVLGTAPWLVLAGLTEGFVTPHALPLGAALTVGAALGALYWSLVCLLGRRAAPFTDAHEPSP